MAQRDVQRDVPFSDALSSDSSEQLGVGQRRRAPRRVRGRELRSARQLLAESLFESLTLLSSSPSSFLLPSSLSSFFFPPSGKSGEYSRSPGFPLMGSPFAGVGALHGLGSSPSPSTGFCSASSGCCCPWLFGFPLVDLRVGCRPPPPPHVFPPPSCGPTVDCPSNF